MERYQLAGFKTLQALIYHDEPAQLRVSFLLSPPPFLSPPLLLPPSPARPLSPAPSLFLPLPLFPSPPLARLRADEAANRAHTLLLLHTHCFLFHQRPTTIPNP